MLIAVAGPTRGRQAAIVAAALLAAGAAYADNGFAGLVPADVGLFVELREADDLLVQLVEPQLWLTLAELAGQPASLRETEHWRQQVQQTLQLSPPDAIHALFSQRVAFVAEGLRNTQDAVVLCRPAGDRRELLRRWQARPLPTSGRTAVYRLPNNVGLAVHGDVLVFGDQVHEGMFERVLAQLEGAETPPLADEPEYQRLLARAPSDPDGVLFVRLDQPGSPAAASAPARSPVPELRQLLRGSSNVLLVLHRASQTLHVSVVSDGPGATPPHEVSLMELAGRLPGSTLAVWAGHVDYPGLAQVITSLPERSIFRVAYQLQRGTGSMQRLLAAMNSATCVALGTAMPENRVLPAPPIPALAVLVAVRDAQAVATEWSHLFGTTLALYRLLALKVAQSPPLPPIESMRLEDADAEVLDLSLLVGAQPEQTPLGELHLCWALDDGVLIVASHVQWLREILSARHGHGPQLAGFLEASNRTALQRPETLIVGQTAALGDLGTFWLHYCERFAPGMLTEDWWRKYQPGDGEVRLGAQVTVDPERPRLLVRSVTPDSPADGILRPGDEIIGCNRRRFSTSQPVAEIHEGLAQRPHARWIDLLVERDRIVRVRRVPLPFVDPLEIVRRVSAIGRVAQRVVYVEEAPDEAGTRGYLTLELRTDPHPQFKFAPPPVSHPVSSPASPPGPATSPATQPEGPPPTQPAAEPDSALSDPGDAAPEP